MLPDELFLFTVCLAVNNTQLNDIQKQNQERIERKIDLIIEKLNKIEDQMKDSGEHYEPF